MAGVTDWATTIAAEPAADTSPLLALIGRLHPLAVHAPLGALGLLLLLEFGAKWTGLGRRAWILIYGFLAATCGASLATGWIHAGATGAGGKILTLHQTLAIAATALSVVAVVIVLTTSRVWPRRVILLLLAGALSAAGHWGGTMVHGENWLALAPRPERPLARESSSNPATSPGGWPKTIAATFEAHCNACHGERMQKGGLRTDSLAALLQGGKSGPALVVGSPSQSLFWQRMGLPLDDEDHMPPQKKPQPSAEARAQLLAWLTETASDRGQAPEVRPPSPILEQRGRDLLAQLEAQGVTVTADGDDYALRFDAAEVSSIDATLASLSSLAPWLTSLNLARTSVSDAGLASLASLHRLRRVDISRTKIRTLTPLKDLRELETVVAVECNLPWGELMSVLSAPALREVFWLGNEWSDEKGPDLARSHPTVKIIGPWSESRPQSTTEGAVVLSSQAPPPGTDSALHPKNQQCPIDQKPTKADFVLIENQVPVAFCSLACLRARLDDRIRESGNRD